MTPFEQAVAQKHIAAALSFMKRMIIDARKRARKGNIEFCLTMHDMERMWANQGGCCAMSGIPMEMVRGEGSKNPWVVSIDRIDNAHGYTPENSRLVCCIGNLAKSEWSDEVLRTFAKAFVNFRPGRTPATDNPPDPPQPTVSSAAAPQTKPKPPKPERQRDNLLTPLQVRERLGLRTKTSHTVMRWAKRGLLTPIYLGPRTVRFHPDDVDRAIALSEV